MTRPGLIIMAIIAVAVGLASLSGQRELFARDRAQEAERAALALDRG